MSQLSEKEARDRVQEEVNRLSLTSGYIGYCTRCSQDRKYILFSSLIDMTTECVDCYAKRRLNELFSVEDMKRQRSDQVRQYFATRKEKSF
jgi:hypothetical protein